MSLFQGSLGGRQFLQEKRFHDQSLLVEVNEAEVRDACSMLQQAGEGQMEVIRVAKLSAALRPLSSESFDVILLDGVLVDPHALTTLDLVQAALSSMPLVLLSNQDDPALERKAIQ